MGDERLSNLSLMHTYTQTCARLLMTLLTEGIGALTFHKLIQVKKNEYFMMNESSRVSGSLSGLVSTRAHLIFQRSTSSTKSTFLLW
jgi:hypothetical protein